jgi:hypothetical protein
MLRAVFQVETYAIIIDRRVKKAFQCPISPLNTKASLTLMLGPQELKCIINPGLGLAALLWLFQDI